MERSKSVVLAMEGSYFSGTGNGWSMSCIKEPCLGKAKDPEKNSYKALGRLESQGRNSASMLPKWEEKRRDSFPFCPCVYSNSAERSGDITQDWGPQPRPAHTLTQKAIERSGRKQPRPLSFMSPKALLDSGEEERHQSNMRWVLNGAWLNSSQLTVTRKQGLTQVLLMKWDVTVLTRHIEGKK